MTTRPSSRRAIGVVRVSRVGDRDGERFVSPSEQAERIRSACERDGLKLVDVIEELDVSGGAPVAKRPGLRRAVELVEAHEADVLVVAFFDRLVRSLTVQAEVVGRVEAAGGAILAVDVGQVTNGSAGQWLSGTMLGAVSEYARRVTAERTADAKSRAVARGVAPFPNLPPGLRRGKNEKIEVDGPKARVVAEAVRMRADGETIDVIRKYLHKHGIRRSYHGTQALLGSRMLLGELHFGDLVNENAFPAIIDTETWQRAQRVKVPRGRRPKSERLLARLGVLRCGTCGARMVVGTSQGRWSFYRCPPIGDCPQRTSISAEVAENTVAEVVQDLLAGIKGSASVEGGAEEAAREVERNQEALDKAIHAYQGLEDEEAARVRLQELREERDRARERYDDLNAAAGPAITVSAGDWQLLSLKEQRALIRAVVDRAVVRPGRGPDRITVEARGQ